jgi:hypothetical protein
MSNYAEAARDEGSDLISTFFGNEAVAIGAVISNMPFRYSAVIFSLSTPSGSTLLRVNDPYGWTVQKTTPRIKPGG